MYALFRILFVNTLWRMIRARNERIEDAEIQARVAASFPPTSPHARKACPDCGTDLPASARYCTGCLKAF